MRPILLLTALLLAGCDPFAAAQREDTIEAYEAFLDANPTSPWRIQAESRLESLRLVEARQQGTLEAFDAWLAAYPRSAARDDVIAEREDFLWAWAEAEGTTDGWTRFLAEYPSSARRGEAERKRRVIELRGSVAVENPRVSRINLAEDPEGPLNGWKLEVDVRNTGTAPLTRLVLAVRAEGTDLADEWPVAAERWTVPLEEATKLPLGPGELRTWVYTTRDAPESWDGRFDVAVSDVRAAE